MPLRVAVIGSGFAGLAAAALLAQADCEVDLFEKNDRLGGRARTFAAAGFTFDMGPSWYWMPDVFENFYKKFGARSHDFYQLVRLDPSYTIVWQDDAVAFPAGREAVQGVFERLEPGSAKNLAAFLDDAAHKYRVGMTDFVFRPALSPWEFVSFDLLKKAWGIDLFTSVHKAVRRRFKHPKLVQMLEFPVLFLGATAKETPALYTLMNHADIDLGTYFPRGGMGKVVEAFIEIARSQGVRLHVNAEVTAIASKGQHVERIVVNGEARPFDVVLNAGDYAHCDRHLLAGQDRAYPEAYWDARKLAPSSLLYFLGLDAKLPASLTHHNLFFDTDFEAHAEAIYTSHSWPVEPLFYLCASSKTDGSLAPANGENVFVLIPSSTALADTPEVREQYFQKVCERVKMRTGFDLRAHVVYRRDFARQDFIDDYYSFKGNAYGLANTLDQTAFLKPKMRHKKLGNLFHAGQLTTPGPGVPPSIISGQVAAGLILREFAS